MLGTKPPRLLRGELFREPLSLNRSALFDAQCASNGNKWFKGKYKEREMEIKCVDEAIRH